MIAANVANWQTESLRHTTFLLSPIEQTESSIWEQLIGKAPDEKISRPSERLTIEAGEYSTGTLHVESRSDRIDWRLSFNPKNPPGDLPTLGPYAEAFADFHELLLEWPKLCPPTTRIAFGAVLLWPVSDLHSAYRLISDMMPLHSLNLENTTDFLFRTNRKRDLKSNGLELRINRISTWSIASISRIQVDVSSPEKAIVRTSDDSCICRLELDMNTAPDTGAELENHLLSDIFTSLVNWANEIATQGDIS